MITKYTLTTDDGATHDFLSMDDAIQFAVNANTPATTVPAPATEPTAEELKADVDAAIDTAFTPKDAPADTVDPSQSA